jgi:hypothetical protein
MEGTENIKTCVGFVLDLTEDVQKSLADGKFNLKDSLLFVDNVPQVPQAIKSAFRFWAEFQEMDEAEEEEVLQFVRDRLNCNTDRAKEIVVQSFQVAMTIADAVTHSIELVKIIKAA